MVYLRNRIRQTDESDHSEFNYMSPIRPVITTITRKSVNMVAELDNDTAPSRILDASGQRLEDYSKVAKAAMAIAVALDTKARAAQGTVVQLKSELNQSQQSRTEAKTRADSLSVITFKPPSEFGTDTVVGRIPGRLAGESPGQAREHYIPFGSACPRATRSTGQGSVDRRLEDDGGSSRGRYSST